MCWHEGIEGDLSCPFEEDLHPQVRIFTDESNRPARRSLRVKAHDDARGDSQGTQHERHGDRILVVVADPLVLAEEPLNPRRPVSRQRQLIGAIGVEALVVQLLLDRADLTDPGGRIAQ